MKKILLLLLMLTACINSFAQSKDSLKIIKTNEWGLPDPERKMPLPADSLDFKNQDYVKGRLVVKFKPNILNFAILSSSQLHKEAIKIINSTSNVLSDSLSFYIPRILSILNL